VKPRTRRDGSNYARGAAAGTGYRNGYRRGRLKTAKGVVDYAAPQICDRAFRFARDCARSSVAERRSWRRWRWRCMRAGCRHATSKRLFADEDGRSLLSRTAVSEVTERLWAQYEAFASRDLSEFEVIYLFVDGIAERLHLGQPREAVLAAWGVLADGHRVLLHLAPGSKEDTASCREFFQDMRRRGLPACFRRTRRTQTDVCCADPRGRTLARLAHDRIRTPPTDRDPQRAQSRSRRANRADRKRKCQPHPQLVYPARVGLDPFSRDSR